MQTKTNASDTKTATTAQQVCYHKTISSPDRKKVYWLLEYLLVCMCILCATISLLLFSNDRNMVSAIFFIISITFILLANMSRAVGRIERIEEYLSKYQGYTINAEREGDMEDTKEA